MRERIATIGPIAAVGGAFGLCCALPVLLWLGVVGAIAGWSLQSWTLVGLGLALAAVGWARWVRSRRQQQSCQGPVPPTPVDAATVQTADSTTDISTDVTARENNL